MGNIILPGFNGFDGAGQTEFGVRLVQPKTGGCKLFINGKGEHIIQMLFQSMQDNPDFAKFMFSTVMIFCREKKIPLSEIPKHSFPQNSPGAVS